MNVYFFIFIFYIFEELYFHSNVVVLELLLARMKATVHSDI